ncbi:MAG TPA: hypothetical protein VFZ62_00460 [Candidatus Saccharimonadales bacterium]
MSTSTITISSRRNNIQTAIASFVGMALAIPVALFIVSMTQPASALKNDSNNNNYALYAEAFTKGFMANTADASTGSSAAPVSCEAPKDDEEQKDMGGMGAAVMHHGAAPKHNADLVKHINNSYNEYTTNITNKDSNNTVQSVVTVSHSNGAVVSTGTSTSGGVDNKVDVENKDSGNTVNVNSHNTTNTETNVDIEDSFNHEVNTTIDNSKTIKDSFNKEVELDVDVKIEDSGNTVLPKPQHS